MRKAGKFDPARQSSRRVIAGPRRVRGSTVVVTGASSGNGRAIARALAEEGANLVLAARDLAALQAAAAECRRLGAQVIVVSTDMSEPEQVAALAAEALKHFGGVDTWVNNAAVLHFGRLDETPPEVIDQVIRTNVLGYLNGAREALRIFRRARRGVLINVSSILSAIGHPYTAPYVTSKFAIRGLTESLRAEVLDEPQIRVCAVLPAAIDTPIYRRAANFTGRQVRPIRILHPPEAVGAAVVRVARRPARQAFAGWSARPAVAAATIAPSAAARAARLAADTMEMGEAPADPAPGNLFEPDHGGDDARGGWRPGRGRGARLRLFGALALLGAAGLMVRAHRRPGALRPARGMWPPQEAGRRRRNRRR